MSEDRRRWEDLDSREKALLDAVRNSTGMKFTELAMCLKDCKAPLTVRRKRDALIEDDFLLEVRAGRNKYYLLPDKRVYVTNEYESEARKMCSLLLLEIKRLQERYEQLSEEDRTHYIIRLCKIIQRELRNLNLLQNYFPPHKEHHQELIAEYQVIYRSVLDRVKGERLSANARETIFEQLFDPNCFFP